MFINALMLPQFDYLDIIWCKTSKANLKSLDVLYKKVAKIALDMDTREASIKVYCTMKWLPVHLRRQLHLSTYMYKILNNITPTTFLNKFVYVTGTSRNAGKCNLYIPTSRSHKTLSYLGAKCWNAVPEATRNIDSLHKFSHSLKHNLLNAISIDEHYTVENRFDQFYQLPD